MKLRNLQSTFHRDNSVTIWNVYTQVWERYGLTHISDRILASLSANDRKRIETKLKKNKVEK